jgi:hypothetical protein
MAVGQANKSLVHASPEKCRKSQGLSERLRAIAKITVIQTKVNESEIHRIRHFVRVQNSRQIPTFFQHSHDAADLLEAEEKG